MTIKINNLVMDLDGTVEELRHKVSRRLKVNEEEFKSFKILKESIDARHKNDIKVNYAVSVKLGLNGAGEEKFVQRLRNKDVIIEKERFREELQFGSTKLSSRPVVAGMGPAGLFAALILAENGYRPIVIERGQDVDNRTSTIEEFWDKDKRILNPESNVQFGEGGAGTFSDGKLTTRIKDSRCSYVLERFVEAGAPEEITYVGKPHIGTDILKDVVKNIREKIISLGGEVRFSSKLTDIKVENGKLKSIEVNGEPMDCEALILAIGHSARDTYEMLYKRGVFMEQKPFAIGARIEHLQSLIDESQYGVYATHPKLKTADYKLTYTSKETGRAVYSFCMCPGGRVVAAASEENMVAVNGMSYYKRDLENANSALVVSVGPDDFKDSHPLSGMEFQRHYESLAYKVGGGNYNAPAQMVKDFLKGQVSTKLGNVTPSYEPGITFADLSQCLPSYVIDTLKEGIMVFDKRIKGYGSSDAILTGIETRTSAPVRIKRDENGESLNTKGLYPSGEGAGYAGGIVSAAVDGMKAAEKIIQLYCV